MASVSIGRAALATLGVVALGLVAPVAEESLATPTTPAGAATTVPAYWLVASDGGIFSFGGATYYGSMGGQHLNQPIVGIAATRDDAGYWEVASDGGIFAFGDAPFYGSMGGQHLNQPIVGIAGAAGGGYWEVASDGGIFSFGNAPFYGSMGGRHLNQPIVGMAATPSGNGYWLVASDGGIFAFGDAQFHGSMGGHPLNKPIVGMTATADGGGYWFTASDGGVFAFGDAGYFGSLGGLPMSRPVAAMAATRDGNGYWFTNNNGAVSGFGDAGYYGSAPQVLNAPVVGMAATLGNGAFGGVPFQSGTYGFDVSKYQCGQLPSQHTFGVVEVDGWSNSHTNPCLAAEASWAGAGLNLYTYLTTGASSSGPGICGGNAGCNFGYGEAQHAFADAQAAGVSTGVTWWLDVESSGGAFQTGSQFASGNADVVQGAIYGLEGEGINNVGIYLSADNWQSLLGSYSPGVPLWIAWYSGNGGPYGCTNARIEAQRVSSFLPPGPIVLTQYTDTVNGQSIDGDYAC